MHEIDIPVRLWNVSKLKRVNEKSKEKIEEKFMKI